MSSRYVFSVIVVYVCGSSAILFDIELMFLHDVHRFTAEFHAPRFVMHAENFVSNVTMRLCVCFLFLCLCLPSYLFSMAMQSCKTVRSTSSLLLKKKSTIARTEAPNASKEAGEQLQKEQKHTHKNEGMARGWDATRTRGSH
mmetsp:Transcript_53227/g.95056  ORF Transcript_53227/g.95056 Transcript_53227/m.95056 type:complete len:142 (-) Transcript_53227:187-612(-)